MRKRVELVFIIACFVIISLPIIFLNKKKDIISNIDNRKLVEAPVFGEEGYIEKFEKYIQDRIGFRDTMVNDYNVLNDIVFNELTHPIYTYGIDGYVFFPIHRNITYNDYHIKFANMVKKVQDYCESRGTKFYFLFEPEKLSVYRKYLPVGVNYDDSWVDEMLSYMNELEINYIDTRSVLFEKSKTEKVFNKEYDAGHWNDLGCYYATNELWKRMQADIPNVTPMKKNEFAIGEREQTTLPVSEFAISEMVPYFALKQEISNETDIWRDEVYTNPSYPAFFYEVNKSDKADELPKILFFQGSYYNRNPQFIVSRASTYVGVHNYQNLLNIPYYCNIFQPDVVILDAAEYVFDDVYWDRNDMQNMDLNPCFWDNSQPINEQIDIIKADANYIKSNIELTIIQGDRVDYGYFNKTFLDAKYVYLVTDDYVYDVTRGDNNLLEISAANESIEIGSKPIIVVDDGAGMRMWSEVNVVKGINFLDIMEPSSGVEINGDGIVFTTDKKDNIFTSVNLQLYDGDTGEYICDIDSLSEEDKVTALYKHNMPTGNYIITFKANSTLQDEVLSIHLTLVEGRVYPYTFDIDMLAPTKINVSDFNIKGTL